MSTSQRVTIRIREAIAGVKVMSQHQPRNSVTAASTPNSACWRRLEKESARKPQTEGRGRVADRAPDVHQASRTPSFSLAVRLAAAVELPEEVDGVVHRDPEHDARHQARGDVERDAAPAQDPEVEQHRQDVRDHRDEADPEGHELQRHDPEDAHEGRAHADRLSVGDLVVGLRQQHQVSRHAGVDARGKLGEPRLDAAHQGAQVGRVERRGADADVRDLILRVRRSRRRRRRIRRRAAGSPGVFDSGIR